MDMIFPQTDALEGTVSRRRLVNNARRTILNTGFIGFSGLRFLTPERVARSRELGDRLFSLPREELLALEHREIGGQRGMNMTFGLRKGASQRDLKVYWHHGPNRTPDDPMYLDCGDNIPVPQVPGFNAEMDALHADFVKEMDLPLEVISETLNLPPRFLPELLQGGDDLVRKLLYFPFEDDTPEGTMWTGEHTDSDFVTGLLPGVLEGEEMDDSLELQLRNGVWTRVPIPRDTIMINIGDFLEKMTRGRYRSTPHRVGPPRKKGVRRLSDVCFRHARREVMLPALELDEATFGAPLYDWKPVCAGYALFEVLMRNNAYQGRPPYLKTGRDPSVPPLVNRAV